MGAAVPEYVNVTKLTSGSSGSTDLRIELARRQTLCHPSGECANTAPGGIRFPIRYVVPQFHLPTINRIAVIINLQGQPSSETPYIIRCRVSCRLCDCHVDTQGQTYRVHLRR